jgi:CRP-like cAMP-binding protein
MDRTQLTNAVLCALDDDTYERLAGHLSHEAFQRGALLQEQNEPVRRIYFPHSGVIALLVTLSDGTAIETSTVGRESGVGLTAALAPARSFNRAVGQADGVASWIDADRLRSVARDTPRLREVIVRHGEALLAQAHQAVACNALHDVEERFCRWLLTCLDRTEQAEIQLTQELLARMLGVQRTTVTQVAGMLQAAGLIRIHRGRIEILDRGGLEHRACECYRAIRSYFEMVAPDPAPDGPCATAA